MTVILANAVITSRGEVIYNVDMAAALLTAIPPLICVNQAFKGRA